MKWERWFRKKDQPTPAITDTEMRARIVAQVTEQFGHIPIVGEVAEKAQHASSVGTCNGQLKVSSVTWDINNMDEENLPAWGYCTVVSMCDSCDKQVTRQFTSS